MNLIADEELPSGWAQCRIGEISPVVGGGTPPSKDTTNFTAEGGIPWLTPADLSGYKEIFIARGARNLTEKGFSESSAKMLPRGALLFSSRAPVGYVAIASNPICTNQGFKSFVLPQGFDPRFGYFHLRHIKPLAEDMATGTTFKELSGGTAGQLPFLVAPLNEQKRIADKLEAVLGRVDACRARLDRVPDLLKRFRQSVLAAATSGQLTEDWREEHKEVPVEKSLAEADSLRQEEVRKANASQSLTRFRYKPAALIDLENQTKGIEELFPIPQTWAWASVGQLTWAVADGPHFSPKYVQQDVGVPFISGRNISYRGIDFSDAKYVSRADHAEFQKRAKPEVGDVLLTKGGTTGIATVVSTSDEFSIWVHVALLKPVSALVDPRYLRDALTAPSAYAQSQALTHGVGNQDLGLTRMVHIALPLPPLAEQAEIVRRVEALFALADRIEARLATAQRLMERLTPATLSKAFRGDLVPQDPNDEPASKLLERLRRAGAEPKAQRKKSS